MPNLKLSPLQEQILASLPSERWDGTQFDASAQTVSRALARLERRGLVRRVRSYTRTVRVEAV